MTVNELIAIAKKEIGVKEIPANSNNVKYNTWMYGREVHDGDTSPNATYPWCASFVSWCFKGTGLVPKTASCLNMLEWFERRGQTVKEPRPGDIVFFHYSTNARRTNHVGIVVGVDGKIIKTIEGNTSVSSNDNGGCVMARSRNKNIVAYARPKYDDAITPIYNKKRPTLRIGSTGEDVLYLHKQLKKCGYGVDPKSDYFSSLTDLCVQNFQVSHFLKNDGVVGPLTWAEIDKIK